MRSWGGDLRERTRGSVSTARAGRFFGWLMALLIVFSLFGAFYAGLNGMRELLRPERIEEQRLELVALGMGEIEPQVMAYLARKKQPQEVVSFLQRSLGAQTIELAPRWRRGRIGYRLGEPLVYVVEERRFALDGEGRWIYVAPSKRFRHLGRVFLPQADGCHEDDLFERGGQIRAEVRFFLSWFRGLRSRHPAWKLAELDLRAFSRGFFFSGEEEDLEEGEFVATLERVGGEAFCGGIEGERLKIYFRMGYGFSKHHLEMLQEELRFQELFSGVHPMWKSCNGVVFDLRFQGAIYYKALGRGDPFAATSDFKGRY